MRRQVKTGPDHLFGGVQGGATVVVTTWNRTDQMLQYDLEMLRGVFETHGSKGARLIGIPCNCCSSGECNVVHAANTGSSPT